MLLVEKKVKVNKLDEIPKNSYFSPLNKTMKKIVEITDEELMLNTLNKDKKSYYLLVKRWQKKIINFFYKNTQNRQTSEDLAQEVFLKVWKTKKYNTKASFYSWLYRIANNTLIDHYRKSKKNKALSVDEKPEIFRKQVSRDITPEEKVIKDNEEKMVREAINNLTKDQKEILILSKFQMLDYESIGKIIKCSKNNVKVKVFRAIKSFGKKYKEMYEHE